MVNPAVSGAAVTTNPHTETVVVSERPNSIQSSVVLDPVTDFAPALAVYDIFGATVAEPTNGLL
jgi:hypothetical protein